jgi:hypothetical protein
MAPEKIISVSFVIFIFIGILLIVYQIICGRWLARKSITLANDVNGNFYRGLKALAFWPLSIFALIIVPLYIASLSHNFDMSLNQRNIVLMISLIPGCLYNIYYRFKILRENEKKD